MNRIVIFLISLMITLACGSILHGNNRLADGPVRFNVVLSGAHSSVENGKVSLIKDESDWRQIWILARGNEDPLPDMPEIDFRSEYVIAAFMGQRSSAGYKIEITDIEKKGKILKVNISNYETPGMLPVVTRPYTLVRIPKGDYRLEVKTKSIQ